MFSIVKVARDQTRPGSLLARPRGRLDERPWERGWQNWCLFVLIKFIFHCSREFFFHTVNLSIFPSFLFPCVSISEVALDSFAVSGNSPFEYDVI